MYMLQLSRQDLDDLLCLLNQQLLEATDDETRERLRRWIHIVSSVIGTSGE